MNNHYYKKYLKYKTKYLELRKQIKGGAIQDIYQYLEQNINNINPTHFNILQEYANSLIIDNPNITVDQFISNVNTIYGLNLPQSIVASRPLDDRNLIIVYTTGIAYFVEEEPQLTGHVRALIENIRETCERSGKRVRFIHYDMFNNPTHRLYRDERFIRGYLTLEIIQAEIENNPNALLVDLAHIILYERSSSSFPKIIFETQSFYPGLRDFSYTRGLNINAFYPGYIGDIKSTDFLRSFKFFQFVNNEIVTYIQKGIEKNIKLMGIGSTGERTVLCDFTQRIIQIYSYFNYAPTTELNSTFWK